MKRFIQGAVLMVLIAMASAMATTNAAMLHGNGSVSVNGNAVMPTSTVFTGDRIETAPNSALTLTTNGSSVLVGQNSSLIFNGETVSFSMGSAVVKTTQGMVAKFQRVVITPGQSATRFQLLQKGNMLTVAALEGNLSIFDGRGGEIALSSGKQVDIALDNKDRDDKTAGGDVQNPTPTPTPAPDPNTSGIMAGMIAGSGAVMGVALTAILSMTQKPVSPSGP